MLVELLAHFHGQRGHGQIIDFVWQLQILIIVVALDFLGLAFYIACVFHLDLDLFFDRVFQDLGALILTAGSSKLSADRTSLSVSPANIIGHMQAKR